MSRRDTVIIAVLINAGLLIVLFATALKTGDKKEELASASPGVSPSVSELPIAADPKVSGDEVDQVLNQYAVSSTSPLTSVASALSSPISPVPHIAAKEASSSPSSFADDLQSISLPPPTSVPVSSSITSSLNGNGKESAFTEVAVKKGDVLEKIARVNATTVEEIMRLNQLSSTKLKIGQVLRIPGKTVKAQPVSAPVVKAVASPAKNSSAPKLYTVKNGDNPWTIAVKNHMKVEELLKLNSLDEEKARHLKPGDQLRIR